MNHVTTTKTNPNKDTVVDHSDWSEYINISLVFILVQIFCSCFAGVYNEYLLKDSNKTHIMIQNIFMYIDSIICNILLLSVFNNQKGESISIESIKAIFQFEVLIIMINNAAIGIVTSLFLKSLNSILKAFASALELMFTGILSWLIFGFSLDMYTCIAIAVVSFSTWLYSMNPVQNPPKEKLTVKSTDSSV
jgi:UDP-sugar transporter A1/2/3